MRTIQSLSRLFLPALLLTLGAGLLAAPGSDGGPVTLRAVLMRADRKDLSFLTATTAFYFLVRLPGKDPADAALSAADIQTAQRFKVWDTALNKAIALGKVVPAGSPVSGTSASDLKYPQAKLYGPFRLKNPFLVSVSLPNGRAYTVTATAATNLLDLKHP